MYLLAYTTEDNSQGITDWNDHYELFEKKEDAVRAVVVGLGDEDNVTMWAITKVIDASEPHWMED